MTTNLNSEISYAQAIRLAHQDAFNDDEKTILVGLDINDHKGIYGTTLELYKEFDSARCLSTPLSEDAMTGMCIGAALNGYKAINVHIRSDFLLLCFNQLINVASNFNYISGGHSPVPIFIRSIIGRGWGQGPQHSKSFHSTLSHIPGLKVIMPVTPHEAYHLSYNATFDPNPVISFEHRWLFNRVGILDKEEPCQIGKAIKRKEGLNITIVSVSWMSIIALEAATLLEEKLDISVEIIDPLTISPLDRDAIINSVNKTNHCIVLDYDWIPMSFSSEVCAIVQENCFYKLKKPIKRLGFFFSPCPTVKSLEDHFYPDIKNILEISLELMDLDVDVEIPKLLGEINGQNDKNIKPFPGPF